MVAKKLTKWVRFTVQGTEVTATISTGKGYGRKLGEVCRLAGCRPSEVVTVDTATGKVVDARDFH